MVVGVPCYAVNEELVSLRERLVNSQPMYSASKSHKPIKIDSDTKVTSKQVLRRGFFLHSFQLKQEIFVGLHTLT